MQTMPQPTTLSSPRDAWVEIDLGKLESNLQIIRSWLGQHEQDQFMTGMPSQQAEAITPLIMGVVKSDAYGHGAPAVASVLSAAGISWLGVASIEEGSQLRRYGIKLPILILSPTPNWGVSIALDYQLDITITSLAQMKNMCRELDRTEKMVPVHLKVETGMHRLGLHINDLPAVLDYLESNPKLELISIFSHLAKGSELETTRWQDERFREILKIFADAGRPPKFAHLAASEAARRFPFTRHDLVRIGLNLYGLEANALDAQLQPILSLRGRVNHMGYVKAGESVGYGFTWHAERDSKIASIPIGYADGVDRRLSNKIEALYGGHRVKQVGNISMDQMLFDVTDVEGIREGDVLTLIGQDLRTETGQPPKTIVLSDWASLLGTITYELACRLRVRLPRIYTRQTFPSAALEM